MADPTALQTATAAAQAVALIGLPEAQLNLAHAVIHLATAPKSNAVVAGDRRGAGRRTRRAGRCRCRAICVTRITPAPAGSVTAPATVPARRPARRGHPAVSAGRASSAATTTGRPGTVPSGRSPTGCPGCAGSSAARPSGSRCGHRPERAQSVTVLTRRGPRRRTTRGSGRSMTTPERGGGPDGTGRPPSPGPRGRWRGRGGDAPVPEEETGWIDGLREAQETGADIGPGDDAPGRRGRRGADRDRGADRNGGADRERGADRDRADRDRADRGADRERGDDRDRRGGRDRDDVDPLLGDLSRAGGDLPRRSDTGDVRRPLGDADDQADEERDPAEAPRYRSRGPSPAGPSGRFGPARGAPVQRIPSALEVRPGCR